MPSAFSFNREFDFVRLDGLRRATGRPAHEWDLYILKELLDNALDADEALWHAGRAQFPDLRITIEYIDVPGGLRQLSIEVRNRAIFPAGLIADIFATQRYTSRKAFIKGLTRGALGNALKTLLGIPYALRNRVAGDWSPDLKPLTIRCGTTEYLPRYHVDATAQTIDLTCEQRECKRVVGTAIRVALDHFEQEVPRTLAGIEQLARQYHLCNPHARCEWTVELDGQEWSARFEADPGWAGKFHATAPLWWYSPAAFQDVLGALYRKHCGEDSQGALPVAAVCRCFAGCGEQEAIGALTAALGQDQLSADDIESPVAARLYEAIRCRSQPFDSQHLGRIGGDHLRAVLAQALALDGEAHYAYATDDRADPGVPFVLELVVAPLRESRRQIWTAINFAPTYGDPFFRRRLSAPILPDEPVLGLRGLLDAYGLREDAPVLVFLHLICPNIEHHEFSKTEINHLPFKQALGDLLDRTVAALQQARADEERRLEQAVFTALDVILAALGEGERFIASQLLEQLRARLRQDPALAAWLERPEALMRLHAYIAGYQARSEVMARRVARPASALLALPQHPDRYVSWSVDLLLPNLLAGHAVNKLLYVQARELEDVVIESGWLCWMDLALLRNPLEPGGLQDALARCATCDLPILVLHDADEAGRALIAQMRGWLEERGLDAGRIVDAGLHGPAPTRLVELMTGGLAARLLEQLAAKGIPLKLLPRDPDIRQDVRAQFERLLRAHLWEGLAQQLEIARLLDDLDARTHFTRTMIDQALDRQIHERLRQESRAKSYKMVLDEVVDEFFARFMGEHIADIHTHVRQHLAMNLQRLKP